MDPQICVALWVWVMHSHCLVPSFELETYGLPHFVVASRVVLMDFQYVPFYAWQALVIVL